MPTNREKYPELYEFLDNATEDEKGEFFEQYAYHLQEIFHTKGDEMRIERLREIAKELYWECIKDNEITDPWYRASDDFFDWMEDFLQDRFDLEIEE